MKRLASLFLSLMILLCCVVPVSADNSFFDDSTDGYSIDVTPYLEETYFTFSGVKTINVGFSSLSEFTFSYVDITFRTDSTSFSIGTATQGLAIISIGDDLYRAYGKINESFSTNDLVYFYFNNGSYLDISVFRNFLTDTVFTNIPMLAGLTGTYNYKVYNADGTFIYRSTSLDVRYYPTNDFSIDSPYIHPHEGPSSLNFDDENYTNILLTLTLSFNWKRYDRVDFYFYNNFTDLVDYAFYVDDLNIVSSITPITIDGQTASIVTLDFSNLNRATLSDSCVLRFRGSRYLSSDFSYQLLRIHGTNGFVKTVSNNFLPTWLMKIIDKLDNIFTGSGEDQTAADSFNDSINDQSDELEDLTGELNSVTRPALSDVNLSTSTMVDSGTVVLATSGLGSILSNSIILRVLLMALTFALAGFILFGKR